MPTFHTADGTSLFYCEWGQGEPILFLNSLAFAAQMWDYQFAAFAEQGFRCIGLDRRGHGRSDAPAGGYDFDTFADDVAALIGELDLSGITLITHSMGSGDAVRYLTRHGERRVARLILIAPTTPRLLKSDDNPHGVPRGDFEALWAQWRQDYPKWIDDNIAAFFVPETSRSMMRWGVSLIQASLPVVLACSRTMAEADFRAEMRRIAVPSLLIHGDRDRSMPIEITGKPSAELLQACRLQVYEGGPHGLLYTHRNRLHADILRFIRET